MKQFKLLLALSCLIAITSCESEPNIDARIDNNLVVEQIKLVSTDSVGVSSYKVKLETSEGVALYYTGFKHEVGDTLTSIFEFTDNREQIIKQERLINDSLMIINNKLVRKNDELSLYNELLMGIIQDNAKLK
jgi:hypothetical protein